MVYLVPGTYWSRILRGAERESAPWVGFATGCDSPRSWTLLAFFIVLTPIGDCPRLTVTIDRSYSLLNTHRTSHRAGSGKCWLVSRKHTPVHTKYLVAVFSFFSTKTAAMPTIPPTKESTTTSFLHSRKRIMSESELVRSRHGLVASTENSTYS